ncbi:hypothetical protein RRF57_004100 [Xylaria bambusicola]|uniref:Uncharacterized protein n=1 Tax=Xylaria bambusicola TaxID=326684 RepID=A0AAN7YWU3_9PEZI
MAAAVLDRRLTYCDNVSSDRQSLFPPTTGLRTGTTGVTYLESSYTRNLESTGEMLAISLSILDLKESKWRFTCGSVSEVSSGFAIERSVMGNVSEEGYMGRVWALASKNSVDVGTGAMSFQVVFMVATLLGCDERTLNCTAQGRK